KYFNCEPSVNFIEDWQLLSPIKEKQFGVRALNRKIHQTFKKTILESARNGKKYLHKNGYEKIYRKIPKPFGIEQIVYGDKVINTRNKRRFKVSPRDNALNYIANGEIGIVTGPFRKGKYNPSLDKIEVEFTSQKGFIYRFY